MLEIPIQSPIIKEWMKGGPRRNSSSDMINAAQVSIPATRMTLQGAPLVGTCLLNIRKGRKPKNILGKATITALNALQLLFLPHLCEEYF